MMNLSEKGWLKKYLKQFQKEENLNILREKISTPLYQLEKDKFLYKGFQPSGILYGFPVMPIISNWLDLSRWNEKNRLKLLLADGFFITHFSSSSIKAETLPEIKDLQKDFIDSLSKYYLLNYPEILQKVSHTWFGKKKKEDQIIESIFQSRVELKKSMDANFWMGFFHNSLLFLDLLFYYHWKKAPGLFTLGNAEELNIQARKIILQIIAAASHANKKIEAEEKKLFDFFVLSAELPSHIEKEVKTYLQEGIELKDIQLDILPHWLFKKYLYEMATLTVWADRVLEEEENEFLKQLGETLKLSEQDQQESSLAVEAFVLEHSDKIYFLQNKETYRIVSERFIKSMAKLASYYKNSIITEVHESKELMELLSQSYYRDLTAEEKEKVRQQLIDILKTLPLFTLVALPGRTLTLPVLMKIIPKSALPSAFSQFE